MQILQKHSVHFIIKRKEIKMNQTSNAAEKKLPASQKIGYLFSGVSYTWCMMIPTFVIYFSTQSLGLAIGAVSAMIAIVKVLDAFTDIIAGVIIDKTKAKSGKARPWFLRAAIPYAICMVLLFSIPEGLSQTASLILITILYALVVSVFGTIIGVARYAIVPLMTSNLNERGSLGALGDGVGAFLCGAGFAVTFPIIAKIGYRNTFLIYAIIALIACIICYLLVRENVGEMETEVQEKIAFKDVLKSLFTNKYCLILLIATMCQQIVGSTFTTGGTYFFQYVAGDISYYSKVMTVVMFGSLAAMILMYFIAQKVSSKRIFITGSIITLVMDLIVIISGGTNIAILMVCFSLYLIVGQVVLTSCFAPFAASAVDYDEAKTGVRKEGITSSVTNIGIKIGGALGPAIFGAIAAAGGFVSAAETQSAEATTVLHHALLYTPIIVLIIMIVVVGALYHIEKDISKVKTENIK